MSNYKDAYCVRLRTSIKRVPLFEMKDFDHLVLLVINSIVSLKIDSVQYDVSCIPYASVRTVV